jgi:hypothetical protein
VQRYSGVQKVFVSGQILLKYMRGGGMKGFAMARREKTLERMKPKRAATLQRGVKTPCRVYEFSSGIKPWR